MSEKPVETRFTPKIPVQLAEPKDDPYTTQQLAQCNGVDSEKCWVAIKKTIFDVSGNTNYISGPYKAFAGKDASRALAKSSTKEADVSPDWEDLPESEQKTLTEWIVFFKKRYNIVGQVVDA